MVNIKDEATDIIAWIQHYFNHIEEYDVVPKVKPFEITSKLEQSTPAHGISIRSIFQEFQTKILPGITHWNHPNFFAYFNSSASPAAVMGELLSAAINTNCMLWKSSPAGTELEQVTIQWVQELVGLSGFWGMMFDGGSSSNFHALCAMRQRYYGYDFKRMGHATFQNRRKPRIYISQQTHNSIHKAIITTGFGLDSIHKIPVNARYEMSVNNLKEAIRNDRQQGYEPICVIATLGSTSCTALDPIKEIVEICQSENLWLHIDAAHGGPAAILEEIRDKYQGWECADSIVINPHKWLFVPLDLSILYVKDSENLKQAFSFSAEYLKTREEDEIANYMDYGISLGRRFRALKLWFNLKYFGVEGLRKKIKEQFRLAKLFCEWVDGHDEFEIMAPLTLSTVCFRAKPIRGQDSDKYNQSLMEHLNRTGKCFITHTRLNNTFVLRMVISGLWTEEKHILNFIELIQKVKRNLDEYI